MEVSVDQIRDYAHLVFPAGFSFFEPYLQYQVKEILEIGGEALMSRNPDGAVSGLFIYDGFEKTGTIYTRSREVFDHFYKLKQFDFLFSEMKTEHDCDTFDIYALDIKKNASSLDHRFSHEISVVEGESDASEVEQFMRLETNSRLNTKWVKVALKNGEKCFVARLGGEIAGLGWLSFVNRIGRLHSLYVKPKFRKMKIGEDILFARLLWLKSKNARSAFSEISRDNLASSRIAAKGNMIVAGQVFQYFSSKDADRKRLLSRSSELRIEGRPWP